MVKEIFNDFYRLINGTGNTGLKQMAEKYAGEPLFDIMMANIRCIAGTEVNGAMKEAYDIYKTFSGPDAGDENLERLYEAACAFDRKWQNLWCSQLITAVVAMLDPDREEVAAICEERAGEKPEAENGMEEARAA